MVSHSTITEALAEDAFSRQSVIFDE